MVCAEYTFYWHLDIQVNCIQGTGSLRLKASFLISVVVWSSEYTVERLYGTSVLGMPLCRCSMVSKCIDILVSGRSCMY